MSTIIDANKSRWIPNLKELHQYRQLLYSLALRDVRVRYAQTIIGLLWAIINPIANMLILVFVFYKIANLQSDTNPLVFTLAGLVVWNYFSTLFSESGSSILGAQDMIKKIYFPRLILPISKALSGIAELLASIICLVILMIYFKVSISPNIFFAPCFIMIAILCGCTGGIWMSALTVRYRDFSFLIPYITRLGMFLTPVAYSTSAVPKEYELLYYLNPLTGAIEGFRWSLFGQGTLHDYFYISLGILIVLFITGVIYFTSIERKMADIL